VPPFTVNNVIVSSLFAIPEARTGSSAFDHCIVFANETVLPEAADCRRIKVAEIKLPDAGAFVNVIVVVEPPDLESVKSNTLLPDRSAVNAPPVTVAEFARS
jgi:hypothetical protein